MPNIATQTPNRVKIASFDHAVDASSVTTPSATIVLLRYARSDLRGLALMLIAKRSKSRACGCDRAIIRQDMYSLEERDVSGYSCAADWIWVCELRLVIINDSIVARAADPPIAT